MSGGDKEDLLKQVTLVRDAPTCEAYMERENKLLDIMMKTIQGHHNFGDMLTIIIKCFKYELEDKW